MVTRNRWWRVHGINGWQFGDGYEGKDSVDENLKDVHDARELYKVLLDEVIPVFYEDREKWIDMMRNSIDMSQYRFSAARMVEEYYNLLYCRKAFHVRPSALG